ncbi:hypothetical protein LRP49_02555 [Enterovibrio sp. ZSDZ35]|uniref:Uncharacterized protein n=1 Tax=Enterovibrio qingdaonensis TaxID=2899818 RepID=A0ABT5QGG7_9GAMM|nr:hypothetical protein [Enterovibrio sp. ZSDZ35]MDD1780070.1 hypothetical protein [Enterovibrio sp. ZSDZ35]
MLHQIESYPCTACHITSKHITVLIRNPSPFQGAKDQKRKEFIAGLIKGWAVGPFLASMDEFSRHTICENCGRKTIEG